MPVVDKPKAPRKLTDKQRKFVKAKLEGKTGVEAAMIAYPSVDYSVANAIAGENLKKPSIQEALEAAYAKRGLTIDALVAPHADALTANKVVPIEGDFYETDVPDHTTRMNASKNLAQFIGLGRTGEGTTNYNFINLSRSDKGDYGI